MCPIKILKTLPLILAAILFAALSHYFYLQIGDDSYIYFRYIDRALAGSPWSWSDHIPAVEGYSSPLWYGLLIGAGKLGFSVEAAARALGLLMAVLTVVGCWRLSRYLNVSPFYSACVCLLLVLNQGFHYWSTAGLETSLYMALFVWSALGIASGRFWLLPTALIGVARPEGPFILVALFISIVIFRRQLLNPVKIVLLFLPLLVWLAMRVSIYGEWLPNTFYAKATGDLLPQLAMGLMYCLPVLLPLLVIWALWFMREADHGRMDVLVVLGMITMLLGLVWIGGGDWMFHFRLLLPVLALLWAVQAFYWQQVSGKFRLLMVLSNVFLLALSVPPAQIMDALSGKRLPLALYQEGNMTHKSIILAEELYSHYPTALVAVNHAGALPWAMPNHNVIDMVGLNDGHIARVKGQMHQKYDVDYVLSLKPDLVVLNTRTKPGTDNIWYHEGYWVGETALVNHPDFQSQYKPLDVAIQWDWIIPFPYSMLMQKTKLTSWIVVYQRK